MVKWPIGSNLAQVWGRGIHGLPTLFSLYINDLAVAIKGLNIWVKLGNELVSILLYADDMVLLSESENDMKTLLSTVDLWCKRWES